MNHLLEPASIPDWLSREDKVKLARMNLSFAASLEENLPLDIHQQLMELRQAELQEVLEEDGENRE